MRKKNISIAQKTSAFSRALIFLEKKITQSPWSHGHRLPSIKELSKESGISYKTIWQALGTLQEQNRVVAKPKSGIFVQSSKTQSNSFSLTKSPTAAYVSQQIYKDIIEGIFDDSMFLSSKKELLERYHIGHRTLKQSLLLLQNTGRIELFKRRFRIVRHKTNPAYSTITLISGNDFFNLLEMPYFQIRFNIFFSHFEKECDSRNLQLTHRTWSGRFENIQEFNRSRGFIIWVDRVIGDQLFQIVSLLLQFKQPIVIYDEFHIKINVPKSSLVHCYSLRGADYRAGHDVGTFLLDNNHRNVCFFSQRHDPWSDERYRGICDAFSAAGLSDDSVQPFFSSDFDVPQRNELFQKFPKDKQIVDAMRKQSSAFYKQCQRIGKRLIDTQDKEEFFTKTGELNAHMWFKHDFIPLFRQALLLNNYSAWIFDEDQLAVYGAMNFLKRENIAVPGNISLISFNNVIQSFTKQMTSYDFNFPAIARKILNAILYPKDIKTTSLFLEEVRGFIVKRNSTSTR